MRPKSSSVASQQTMGPTVTTMISSTMKPLKIPRMISRGGTHRLRLRRAQGERAWQSVEVHACERNRKKSGGALDRAALERVRADQSGREDSQLTCTAMRLVAHRRIRTPTPVLRGVVQRRVAAYVEVDRRPGRRRHGAGHLAIPEHSPTRERRQSVGTRRITLIGRGALRAPRRTVLRDVQREAVIPRVLCERHHGSGVIGRLRALKDVHQPYRAVPPNV